MNETLRVKKVIEDDLRSAIENNDLVLHYQPVVTADGSRIVSLEALVRWNHPTGHDPAEPVHLHRRGARPDRPLGEWVLRRACLDGKRWPGMTISVNVSPVQFKQRDFVATVARILAETGFDASAA
jgi:EAL domain-containing protein (putative c-di-GMP-specific phosphodiesterase class I)